MRRTSRPPRTRPRSTPARESRAARADVEAERDHAPAFARDQRSESAADAFGDFIGQLALVEASDVVFAKDVGRDHQASLRLR
jgi:hypothetical protein